MKADTDVKIDVIRIFNQPDRLAYNTNVVIINQLEILNSISSGIKSIFFSSKLSTITLPCYTIA